MYRGDSQVIVALFSCWAVEIPRRWMWLSSLVLQARVRNVQNNALVGCLTAIDIDGD